MINPLKTNKRNLWEFEIKNPETGKWDVYRELLLAEGLYEAIGMLFSTYGQDNVGQIFLIERNVSPLRLVKG